MNVIKHTMLAAAVAAGLGLSVQAADDSSKTGQASQQQSDTSSAQQAGAKQSGGQAGQQQGDKSPDGMFAKMAAIDGMKEVQLAQIAQKNASSDQVKQLAQHIQRDHQQANDKLKPIAQALGVQIPTDLPQEKKEVVQYFQSLQGQQFDQEYISAMKAAHAHDISKFQDKAQVAQNQQLKQWAQECLPKLQQHQQHAMAAAQEVGLPAGGGATALGQGADNAARTAGERLGAGSSSDTTGSASENGLGRSSSGAGSSGQSTGGSGAGSTGGSSGSSSGGGTGSSGAGSSGAGGSGAGSSGSSSGAGSSGSGSGSSR